MPVPFVKVFSASDKTNLVNEVFPEKASFPIEVTELGILTEVKPQDLKADLPISVIPLGKDTDN